MGFGKDGKGVIITEARIQTLGTLAQDTGILIGTKIATLERFRMLKAELLVTLRGLTAGDGGGYALYLCDGDLTLNEIELQIESTGPVGPNDAVAAAIAERFVKLVGVSKILTSNIDQNMVDANTGGPMIVTMPRWTFSRTKSWNWVLYNNGQAPTTGAAVAIKVKNFGVWVL